MCSLGVFDNPRSTNACPPVYGGGVCTFSASLLCLHATPCGKCAFFFSPPPLFPHFPPNEKTSCFPPITTATRHNEIMTPSTSFFSNNLPPPPTPYPPSLPHPSPWKGGGYCSFSPSPPLLSSSPPLPAMATNLPDRVNSLKERLAALGSVRPEGICCVHPAVEMVDGRREGWEALAEVKACEAEMCVRSGERRSCVVRQNVLTTLRERREWEQHILRQTLQHSAEYIEKVEVQKADALEKRTSAQETLAQLEAALTHAKETYIERSRDFDAQESVSKQSMHRHLTSQIERHDSFNKLRSARSDTYAIMQARREVLEKEKAEMAVTMRIYASGGLP